MAKTWDDLVARHKSLTNLILQSIGFIVLVLGFWTHRWLIIGVGVVLEIVGHSFPPPKKPIKAVERFVDALGFRPANFVFQVVGFAIYACGFWQHNLLLIGIGVGIAIVGLIYAAYSRR
jgi:hypothetical protein